MIKNACVLQNFPIKMLNFKIEYVNKFISLMNQQNFLLHSFVLRLFDQLLIKSECKFSYNVLQRTKNLQNRNSHRKFWVLKDKSNNFNVRI